MAEHLEQLRRLPLILPLMLRQRQHPYLLTTEQEAPEALPQQRQRHLEWQR